jgi:Cu/Zn superoxide dismutase
LLLVGSSTAGALMSSGGAGPLMDLAPDTVQPTDGATAQVTIDEAGGSTTVSLTLAGLQVQSAGTTLGAHLHVGPCVAGSGATAGPHYNSTGQPATVVDNTTEVWLDFTVKSDATGSAQTVVPFVIPAGAVNSLVIHEMSTAPNGAAGARWACLPVVVQGSTAVTAPTAVVTPAAPSTAETSLAVTGAETRYLTAGGLGLIAIGAAFIAQRRRIESVHAG